MSSRLSHAPPPQHALGGAVAEIGLDHARVARSPAAGALGDHAALVQHVDVLGEAHHGLHHVLDHQDGDAARRGSRWMTATMSRDLGGLRPAITSSSSSSFGSVASARASSSRLRPATVRSRPGGRAWRQADRAARPPRRRERVGAGRAAQVGADRDVLAHGQAGERLHDLEGARHAAPRQSGAAARR